MTAELRETIAQVLAEHRPIHNPSGHINGTVPGRIAAYDCNCGLVVNTTLEACITHQADAVLAALQNGDWATVKLPKRPSEYWGPNHDPQWNHYPYTRVDGDVIEIGARCEHVYIVPPTDCGEVER